MNEVLLRPVRAVVLGVATGLAAVAMAPVAAQAAEPWGFEQVTPVSKGGGTVHPIDTFRTTPDGNGFLLSATSSFDGVPAESVPLYTRYFASRGADGWTSRAMDPPSNPVPPNYNSTVMAVLASSSDVSHVLVASTLALAPGATPDAGNLYVRNTATGAYTLVATHEDISFARQYLTNLGNIGAKYVAPDGQSALFLSYVPLVPGAPDGSIEAGNAALYSWSAADGVRIVSVLPDSEGGGMPPIWSMVGGEQDGGIRNAVPDSDGLARVYFSTAVGGDDGPAYVRSEGETKAVSVSRIPGASSDPVGATVLATGRGGRFMLFMTQFQAGTSGIPLTPDTPDDMAGTGRFLYRYDAADDSLAYVGALAPVPRSVVQMSQDGRTIAFLSRLGLAPGAPVYDPGSSSADENIYVWRDGVLRFVARADENSIAGSAGSANRGLRVLSSNGRHLAFTENSTGPSSAAALTGANLGSANAECARVLPGGVREPAVCEQVFVYEADADELECASCRTDGQAPTGRSGDPDIEASGMVRMDHRQAQTVADDGTAFFTTAEDLIETDVNGLNDVYAYRDGELRLLSRATQGMSSRFLDATPDGKSVFFSTNDPIAPTDNDKAVDVYMTREGAGFPYTPPIVDPPCTGSDCRGQFAPAEDLPLAGSVAFSGPGNVRPSGARLSVAGGRSIAGTAAKLRVKVSGRGRVTVSGPGVKAFKRSVSRAGTYTVRVALTAKARKALKRSKSVTKRVRVTFRPASGSASKRTLSLTYKSKPTKQKGR